MISEFDFTEYNWLSNFEPCLVKYEGLHYPSTENAYQAAKTLSVDTRIQLFTDCSAANAKRRGNGVDLRRDWEDVKDQIMLDLIRIKFHQPFFKALLLLTENQFLVEGNTWNDEYWGVCNGNGLNKLGNILMQVRNEVRPQLHVGV